VFAVARFNLQHQQAKVAQDGIGHFQDAGAWLGQYR
jgi:hypothetical protein